MLLATKLKRQLMNQAEQRGMTITCTLKNIKINGENRGAHGWIMNEGNGSIVYVNTEHSCYGPIATKSMYRYAADIKDYSSNGLKNGFNQFAEDANLANTILDYLCAGKGIKK